MQLTILFHVPSEVAVPVHYATLVQGLIYRQMQNPALRRYLHEHSWLGEYYLIGDSDLLQVALDAAWGRKIPGLRLLCDGDMVAGYQ